MAKAPRLTIRFTVNRQTGKSTSQAIEQAMRRFANIVVEQVVLSSSEKLYQSAKVKLERSVEKVIRDELVRLTSFYTRYVVGADATGDGPRGNLTGGAQSELSRRTLGQINYSALALTPAWYPRHSAYLARKRREFGHDRWFERKNVLRRWLSRPSSLLRAFGPVSVSFVRTNEDRPYLTKFTSTQLRDQRSPTATAKVGRLEVSVFGQISARMLPSLSSGNPAHLAPDSRTTGLLTLIKATAPATAARLAGRQSVYRHAIEPALSWFMTKGVKNAVFNRLSREFDANRL